jgi:hypothetical protein
MRPGTRRDRHFVGRFLLSPDDKQVIVDKMEVPVGQQAPENAAFLAISDGILCAVDWFLAVDNAGRRWEVRPGQGKRARRIRWYSYRRRYYPSDWHHPVLFPLAVWLFRGRDVIRDRWRARRHPTPPGGS